MKSIKVLTFILPLIMGGAVCAADTVAQISYESCKVCHGIGEGEGAIPSIEGKSFEALLAALMLFSRAEGSSTIMHQFLPGFTDAEIEDLARYVSSLGGESE